AVFVILNLRVLPGRGTITVCSLFLQPSKRRRSSANIDEGIPLSLSEADYRAVKTGWRGAPMSKTSYTRYTALNETRSARTRGNISQRYGSRGRLELLPEEAGGARTKSPKGCKKRKRSERTFCA